MPITREVEDMISHRVMLVEKLAARRQYLTLTGSTIFTFHRAMRQFGDAACLRDCLTIL